MSHHDDESFETIIPQRPIRRDLEPAFFTTTTAEQTNFNKPDREGYVMRNGKAVRVKHPQAGHIGQYDSFVRLKGEGSRWITIVNSQGSVVYYVLTNGAGDMNPHSEYAMDRKQKMRFFGWYPVGQCPVAMLAAGEMRPHHFVNKELLTAQPCQPGTYSISNPCPHAKAEREARIAAHNADQAKIEEAHQNKLVKAQLAQTEALVAAQQATTKAITDGQRELLTTIASALGTKPPEQPSEPPKAKRG